MNGIEHYHSGFHTDVVLDLNRVNYINKPQDKCSLYKQQLSRTNKPLSTNHYSLDLTSTDPRKAHSTT